MGGPYGARHGAPLQVAPRGLSSILRASCRLLLYPAERYRTGVASNATRGRGDAVSRVVSVERSRRADALRAPAHSASMRVRSIAILMLLASLGVPAGARSTLPADGRWDYLIDKLVADGVPPGRVAAVFADPRVGPFEGLEFSLGGRGEARTLYRGFLRPASVAQARRCRAEYDEEFRAAEARFAVPASVVSALLHVETRCGRNTGSHIVFARLARLAMANDPANLERNIARHTAGVPQALVPDVERRVRLRAHELEGVFYPEVLAMFGLADRAGIDPLSLRGSSSGAFGLPQFLPSSYLRFGVDGNGDGRISLYDPADAIASAANYLAHHGWRPGIGRAQERQVIWTYNHSDPYIDTVLVLAARIEQTQPTERTLTSRRRTSPHPNSGMRRRP
jgi:peptidoglycan lytic transglycosylase B